MRRSIEQPAGCPWLLPAAYASRRQAQAEAPTRTHKPQSHVHAVELRGAIPNLTPVGLECLYSYDRQLDVSNACVPAHAHMHMTSSLQALALARTEPTRNHISGRLAGCRLRLGYPFWQRLGLTCVTATYPQKKEAANDLLKSAPRRYRFEVFLGHRLESFCNGQANTSRRHARMYAATKVPICPHCIWLQGPIAWTQDTMVSL